MGKSRKRLAVLLAATMAISMMTGFTSFAEEGDLGEPVVTDATTPDATTPDATTPGAMTPDATTPDATTPDATTPDATTPDAITPDATTPDATTPDATTPDATTPDATTPDATTPDATTPDATTPDATAPDATIQAMPALASAPVSLSTGQDDTTEPEEPETIVYMAGNPLEEKDEFISFGEDKGEYKYNNGTLVLKNVVIEIEPEYGGAVIAVYGTLVIDLEGENSILISSSESEGIAGYQNNNGQAGLTIKGDGSLLISNKGDNYNEDNIYYEGIYQTAGDLTIDGAEVVVDVYSNGNYPGNSAITALDGDINIINGAKVTAKNTAMDDAMTDYYGDPAPYYGISAKNGKINITGASEVIASADGDASGLIDAIFDPDFDGKLQLGIGMMSSAYNMNESGIAGINIEDSNVRSIGSLASMLVLGLDGTIKIDDSTIVSPDNVNVCKLMAMISSDPDAAAQQIGAILAIGESEIDLDKVFEKINEFVDASDMEGLEAYLTELFDSIAKDVNIVRDAELQTQKAGLGISSSSIPTTGDNFQVEGLLIAMIAAGVVIAYCIRRKASA